ncbi:MAG TPA: hypothetical protein VF383_08895 [Candidatus Dormibacteraeota bacterium]
MSKFNPVRVLIGTTTVAALTLLLGVASPVQAAGLKNCADNGVVAPCFEKVWSDGVQVKMTYLDFNPAPSNAPTHNFYVIAPQVHVPQGTVPFLHDHVIGDVSARNDGDDPVHYHAFFVLCSAGGISSGGCVPSMTSIPGLGTVPFAKTVNGQKLTSADPIESPENSGLLTIMDTGGMIVATIKGGR